MARVYNFSAGPAALPLEVLETIRNDLPDWQGIGMSVMEVSHRGKDFVALAARAEARGPVSDPDTKITIEAEGRASGLKPADAALSAAAGLAAWWIGRPTTM